MSPCWVYGLILASSGLKSSPDLSRIWDLDDVGLGVEHENAYDMYNV